MYPFTYTAVTKEGQAIDAIKSTPDAMFLAGGTNLIDEMKLNVKTPKALIDINGVGSAAYKTIGSIRPFDKNDPSVRADGGSNGSATGLQIGALVTNSDLAYDARVIESYPALSQAILSGASAQLRNMATTGGNLLQKTRCTYYRDTAYEQCNKRNPGSGCAALDGYNKMHALLGTSEKCIATHPSDMCVALMALEAVIYARGPAGLRAIPIQDFYVPYGDDPAKETVLAPDELIEFVSLPPTPWFKRSLYLKTRDRASYEFALASAAVAVELDGKTIKNARVALGGVASKPWRSFEAEQVLVGKEANELTFTAAADAALRGAKPQKYNAFKVELAKRTIVQALTNVTTMA